MVSGEMAKALGTRVRMLRVQRGWTQADLLARLSGVDRPISQPTLGRLEAGARDTGVSDLAALARVFDLSLTAFLAPLDPTMGTLVLNAPSVDVRPVVVELGEDTIIRLAKAIAQEVKR